MTSILLIEDDHDTRVTLRRALEQEGYSVHSACNGKDALEKLKSVEQPPSLILLDLMMPMMTGEQFLNHAKTDPVLASVPVVAVTAQAQRVAGLPVNGYIPKPVDLRRLLNTVERACGISA